MYNRLVKSRKGLTDEFIRGVGEFISFALSQDTFVSNGKIRCPCSRCDNLGFLGIEDVKTHLYKYGFIHDYYQWVSHGEEYVYFEALTSTPIENEQENEQSVQTPPNPYRTMVLEASGLNQNFEFDRDDLTRDDEEVPNSVAEKFYELLKATEEPLYEGCKSHTPLSVMARLLNIKSEFNMSQACFNRILQLVRELLPDDTKLPNDFYKTKQMVRKLGLGYQKIHVCVNECILYYKENEELNLCPIFGHSRYKPKRRGDKKQKDIPHKILRYFPLTPRLQRLYLSSKTSEHMIWHKRNGQESETMRHPCDGEAWKSFDESYPLFSSEPRNVRLALSSDGFSPYGQKSHPYSCWPVIITPYNLPPGMCMKTPYMFLTLVIPGPKSPGKNIDLYLQPLIDELKELWDVRVETYDSFRKQNFLMRAALMWTINDFPAYGMLSGWSTHGVLSCPVCMENNKSFYLKEGRKPTFFYCHRQFLPMNHSFRKDKKSFRKGSVEKAMAPARLSSEDVWGKVRNLPKIVGRIGHEKLPGFGENHNWTKQSIFWELPYWHAHLIRHNLDVMHIEKNVFDNTFNTIMDFKGKSKDNIKARKDLKIICHRPDLELRKRNGKVFVPKAVYSLSKDQKKLVCEWVKNLRLPDGYASNLAKCVDMKDLKVSRLKSHDCHVWMERLIPIAFKDLLPESVWNALTELSLFFKGLCSRELQIKNIKKLEESIVVTICKLEKIFPPGFFDSMEHLPIHLPYEVSVGGPMQYRWMYPFERFLHHLKKKVTNKACIEGSICEAYLIEETSTFCSHYFEPHIQTKLTTVGRHDEGGEVDAPDGSLSIFTHPGRPSGYELVRYLGDEEFNAATIYVLLNCAEIEPFVK
ncbi:PREDICTED: uncharacterized protein LOC105961778 [Erythranthe guttata]|uniref:uncharacterized protein LOC105961778 n=1 Tax=Erythranthe guttata TaxID=4155 RepID=UPI00064DBF6A|nr:PREDICTED: uncharacterized protein LOC105961778 [Erythranthe guttata]|eukprot:XP_012841495.1 PREDICTED: uncharacterized protein LOC105961778 [Erythranthe guttata]